MKRTLWLQLALAAAFVVVLLGAAALPTLAGPPVKGAIFTTDLGCTTVNANQYETKDDVYLIGGPRKPGAAGLPDGDYYVKVTQPNGKLLGTSVGSGNAMPIHVTNGEFDECYQLSSLVVAASDSSLPGYDDTGNNGGEYKVWVSNESDFRNNSSKTDNFKIVPGDVIEPQ